jgi:outer membrane lipoprotein-sorting protein
MVLWVVGVWCWLGSVAQAQGTAEPRALADTLVARMRAAENAAKTYTFTLERWEVVDGKRQAIEVMAVSHRKPGDIYARWVGETDKGQELLYRPGWNEGQLRVNPPGPVPTLDLDPRGAVAMRGNRHSIDELGFSYLVGRIAGDHARLVKDGAPDAVFTDLGSRQVSGRPAQCYRARLPRQRLNGLYADQVEICVDEGLGLPTSVDAFEDKGGTMVQVEHYVFRDVKVNPPLSDKDFDPDNPAYDF